MRETDDGRLRSFKRGRMTRLFFSIERKLKKHILKLSHIINHEIWNSEVFIFIFLLITYQVVFFEGHVQFFPLRLITLWFSDWVGEFLEIKDISPILFKVRLNSILVGAALVLVLQSYIFKIWINDDCWLQFFDHIYLVFLHFIIFSNSFDSFLFPLMFGFSRDMLWNNFEF